MKKIITQNGIEFIDEKLSVTFKEYALNLEKGYIITPQGFVFLITGDFIGKVLNS